MSKVTRSKLKFLIYILLQETNKINRKFFQILNDFFRIHSSASRAFVTRKRFSACWGSLHSVPVRVKPRFTEPRAPPIPIERCLRHRATHLRSTPVRAKQTSTGRLLCARSGCFNGSSCQRKRRSESSPRLQKTFTCACGLHAFCSPRLYAFSSLRSAGHCTGQS